MRRLADLVARWPWAVIGVWVAMAVALPLAFLRGEDGQWRAKWLHFYLKGRASMNIVQASPTVEALCSTKVLAASRTGAALRVPQSAWSIQVMPPDEGAYDTGVRTVRCLAGHGLDELKTSQFGQ